MQNLKEEERKGIYKNVDLFKMHAYKDAIRRTAGAYILYPGENTEPDIRKGFHEILPGLGAFALNPANEENDLKGLSAFLQKVAEHLINRTTQREQKAGATYRIYNNAPPDIDSNIVSEPFAEYDGTKKIIPLETKILVGRLKSAAHKHWVERVSKYNFRADPGRNGSLDIKAHELGSTYLLLYEKNRTTEAVLYRVIESYSIATRQQLLRLDYPNPSGQSYLLLSIEKVLDHGLQVLASKLGDVSDFNARSNGGKPFVIRLNELMI